MADGRTGAAGSHVQSRVEVVSDIVSGNATIQSRQLTGTSVLGTGRRVSHVEQIDVKVNRANDWCILNNYRCALC